MQHLVEADMIVKSHELQSLDSLPAEVTKNNAAHLTKAHSVPIAVCKANLHTSTPIQGESALGALGSSSSIDSGIVPQSCISKSVMPTDTQSLPNSDLTSTQTHAVHEDDHTYAKMHNHIESKAKKLLSKIKRNFSKRKPTITIENYSADLPTRQSDLPTRQSDLPTHQSDLPTHHSSMPATPVCSGTSLRLENYSKTAPASPYEPSRSSSSFSLFSPSRVSSVVGSALSGAVIAVVGVTKLMTDSTFDSAYDFELDLCEDDLIPGSTARDKFLDMFTIQDINGWLEETHVTASLEEKGFTQQIIELDLGGVTVDKLRLYDMGVQLGEPADNSDDIALYMQSPSIDNILPYHITHDNFTCTKKLSSSTPKPPHGLQPLLELAMRPTYDLHTAHATQMARTVVAIEKKQESYLEPRSAEVSLHTRTLRFLEDLSNKGLNVLMIEWVLMQNITKRLDVDLVHALPGQQYPGLGIMGPISSLMFNKFSIGQDILLNNPLYFHNAMMYHSSRASCVFLNPEFEGKFLTLIADLEKYIKDEENYGLAVISRALFFGNVIHKSTGRRIRWEAQEQVIPVSEIAINTISKNKEYLDIVEANTSTGVFTVSFGVTHDSQSHENVDILDIEEQDDVLLLSEIDTSPAGQM
eukprot:CFRG7684T1